LKLVLATHNADKVREIKHILAGLDVDLLTVDDFDRVPEPVEDGKTLEANAIKKAREIRDFTGCSALADDTGLEVDALDGAPGVYAARFAGEGATYSQNCDKLLSDLEGVPGGGRGARFRTVMAVALAPEDESRLRRFLTDHPDEGAGTSAGTSAGLESDDTVDVLTAEGIFNGEITTELKGESGFGYDPLFFDRDRGCTLAEMTAEEKNRVSHRYRALVEIRELLLRFDLVHEPEGTR